MQLVRIQQLRGLLEEEELTLVELSEIQEAFDDLVKSGAELSDEPENALAGDMLDELEAHVTTVERTIYAWVKRNFGDEEAGDPSWNISSLAEEINDIPVIFGAEDSKLGYLLGER